jgi:hypothetical protein
MAWTFTVGVTVATFSEAQAGETMADWDSQPEVDVARRLGTNVSEISVDGLAVPTLDLPIIVKTAANHNALAALKGQEGALTDGTTTWTATLVYYLAGKLPGSVKRKGTARFVRSS